ncbi:Rod shape-determining protein RodA [Chlamydiales bacterium SCGC AB-751-O23]|jgi:rod shape determining protein RodA|nr:Rod shape-determining protein RodA [Chlamydiales bacterium SCGC AB-751-O23]
MLNFHYLKRIDFRVLPVLAALMLVSLLVISSYTVEALDDLEDVFFTPQVYSQLKHFLLGGLVYIFCAAFDYHKLREATWVLYILMVLVLVGVLFTPAIHNVHRWYKIPLINLNFQPSEFAKLVVIISLSWFLEKRRASSESLLTLFGAGFIVGIPFILIFKQPDLGTSLVLFPITLVMFYLGGINRFILRVMTLGIFVAVLSVAAIFLGFVSHEELRPYATKVLKEYQYDRFNPNTHHQTSALIAIGSGGLWGKGWKQSEFAARGYLPESHTDSVFPAFAEEFGFVGVVFLLALFYALIYFSFQVTAVAKDEFGRLLSAGVTIYLASHIFINIGMMCGLLPITGFPLILVTYGGSSILFTMAALGILQSIYSRRFMF